MSDSLFQRGGGQAPKLDIIAQTVPMFEHHPYLYDCLKTRAGEGNKVIKGCTIRLGFYLTELQACVTDEPNRKYAYVTLDPFKTLGEALEEVFSSGPLNWQDSRGKRS